MSVLQGWCQGQDKLRPFSQQIIASALQIGTSKFISTISNDIESTQNFTFKYGTFR